MKKQKWGHWAKNIHEMKWIKSEESENLTKMAEHDQQTSLVSACGGIFLYNQ